MGSNRKAPVKKNEIAGETVVLMQQAHGAEGVPYTIIRDQIQLSYSTIMRWRRRWLNGETIIGKPGPKKIEPFDLGALAVQVANMEHGNRKTMGTTELYRNWQNQISRRDLQSLVSKTRQIANTPDHHIEWLRPAVVWSMDDTRCFADKIQQVQDLASRYKFPALVSESMTADKIAKHLEGLFKQYGAPLFLKRDNGANLNHECINQVLDNYWVIPFNSPVRYPPYNGGIERCQGELKGRLPDNPECPSQELIQTILHDLNHMPRRALAKQNACEVFFRERGKNRFNKRQRKEVFEWVKQKASALLNNEYATKPQWHAAWRVAVKMWLENNGCIRTEKVRKVSPNFFELLSHN